MFLSKSELIYVIKEYIDEKNLLSEDKVTDLLEQLDLSEGTLGNDSYDDVFVPSLLVVDGKLVVFGANNANVIELPNLLLA